MPIDTRKTAREVLDHYLVTPSKDDAYNYNRYRAAAIMIAQGRGHWLYSTQWSSGSTLWYNRENESHIVYAELEPTNET